MKPPMCFRHPYISPNLNPYSMCLVCQFKTDCTSGEILEPAHPRIESEWVCKACDDTECHFTVNAALQTIHPYRCPLTGTAGYLGVQEHWKRIR